MSFFVMNKCITKKYDIYSKCAFDNGQTQKFTSV